MANKRKQSSKDWHVLERGSDWYIAECARKREFKSWLSMWIKRGEYETEPDAQAAMLQMQSKMNGSNKYIHKVVRKDERDNVK
ncbi:MAG TPA: hypothetical protein DCS09_11105 [Porphyromonadaceae bacterium]|nr:hypothetical protein [Porphyromonadaceae bacterium]